MLTPVQDDLLVSPDDERLTFAEAAERETSRERLVRLLAEIAAPYSPDEAAAASAATPSPASS